MTGEWHNRESRGGVRTLFILHNYSSPPLLALIVSQKSWTFVYILIGIVFPRAHRRKQKFKTYGINVGRRVKMPRVIFSHFCSFLEN